MKKSRSDTLRTRKSLLMAATDIFAEKGYRAATIAEICDRAGANIAAVNYHFQDKESLYREAWRYSFAESMIKHPPDGGVAADALPEERLRGIIEAFLERIADEDNKEFLIVHKELGTSTGLLVEVMEKDIRPMHGEIEALLRELLGPGGSDEQVRFCVLSIISQCLNPVLVRRLGRRRPAGSEDPLIINDLDAYSDHVVKFSLAGIRSLCRESAKRKRNIKKT